MSYLTILALLVIWCSAFKVACEFYDERKSGSRWEMFQ